MYDSDMNRNVYLDTSVVKKVISNEEIEARKVCEPTINFRPRVSVILCSNHLPKVRKQDKSTPRRFCFMEFLQEFLEDEADNYTEDHLIKERKEIFSRAIKTLPGYIKRGRFNIPQSFKQTSKDFMNQADTIQLFLDQ